MNTLIVYGTTYGYAQDCAHQLKNRLPGSVEVVDALSAMALSLTPYDQVIIGGSVYMGQIQKPVRAFCLQNQEALREKRIGLFLCCGLAEDFTKNLEAAFPEALRSRALSMECFGGQMNLSKMSFIHRTVASMMTKSVASGKTPPVAALPENISRMAAAFGA